MTPTRSSTAQSTTNPRTSEAASQLTSLERRTARGRRDNIDHAPGAPKKAEGDHAENNGFGPGSPDQVAFNAALAAIDGVRPKDEIEAMLAAQMAVTNVALLDLLCHPD